MNEVQTFVFEHLSIRGAIVRLGETWQQVVAQHHYPEELRRLLGEGVAATVLLATGFKARPRISLQLQGEGPIKLLLVQCSSDLEVRGMAQWRSERQDEPLLGAGRLAVNLDMGESVEGGDPIARGADDRLAKRARLLVSARRGSIEEQRLRLSGRGVNRVVGDCLLNLDQRPRSRAYSHPALC